MSILGEKLRKERKRLMMTQKDVGRALRTSKQNISNWEIGRIKPDIYTIQGLAELYKVPIEYLINDDLKEYTQGNKQLEFNEEFKEEFKKEFKETKKEDLKEFEDMYNIYRSLPKDERILIDLMLLKFKEKNKKDELGL